MLEGMDKIRLQRKKDRNVPVDNGDTVLLEEELKLLMEKDKNKGNLNFRLNIIDYELGDLCRATVYAQCFDSCTFKGKKLNDNVIMGEGKLAMADLLIQLNFYCLEVGWDFNELRKLGLVHLKERCEDFDRDKIKRVNE